jgi:hypothetical protein
VGKKSKAKREAKQALKAERQVSQSFKSLGVPSWLGDMLAMENIFNDLDTPRAITEQVSRFCSSISSETPFYIDSDPEPWSRDGCCDLNVMEFMKENGGRVLYGFRIWCNDVYIEAERHAIWNDGESFRDVSFVADGTVKVLFLPDVAEKQVDLTSNKLKIRKALNTKYEEFVATRSLIDVDLPPCSPEEAWNISQTYEQWQGRNLHKRSGRGSVV